jgi:hypothetical protein
MRQHHLVNRIEVARDGVDALDFLVRTDRFAA